MYYEHFGFQSPPFSISPDPRFLYLSERHRDALAHLIYGAGENGGFVLLTGQVGTGKTTLIRSLLSQELANVDIALCLHSGLSVIDFVASVLDELHIDYAPNPTSLKPLVDALNTYLLAAHAAGRQTVLIIDEGQNLSREVLEQVRLLTNLETDSQKLLRIILVGQEELQDSINRDDLRQLSQRITGRYHLTALNAKEVNEYIAHRIKTAKGNPSIFTNKAMQRVYRRSGGVPRLINVLCDRALLVAYNADAYRVTCKHINIAAAETMPVHNKHNAITGLPYLSPAATWALLALGVITLLGVAYGGYRYLEALTTANKLTAAVPTTAVASQSPQQTAVKPVAALPASATGEKKKTTHVAVTREPATSAQTTTDTSHGASTTTPTVTAQPATTSTVNQPESLPTVSTSTVPVAAADTPVIIDKITPTLSSTETATILPIVAPLQKETTANSVQATPLPTTLSATKAPKQSAQPSAADLNAPESSNTTALPENIASLTSTQSTKRPNVIPEQAIVEQGISQTEGVRILLKRWGITNGIPAQQTACEFVESQNMQCLIARGGLPLIRTINRPVLLELKNNNKSSWLPIIGIDSQQQLICLKKTIPQVCDIPTITRYWSGVLLVLLRQPSVFVQIRPGFEGEQIHWLRQRIAIAEKRNLDNISPSLLFDKELVDRVKHFQQSRYIDDDGIVGNETLLYLYNVVADEQTPLLFAEDY